MVESHYGKPNKTIHIQHVSCTGTESSLVDCSKLSYSLADGVSNALKFDAAGVDCIYDLPTQPSCINKPTNAEEQAPDCTPDDAVRLVDDTGEQVQGYIQGRLEYCFKGNWTSLCSLNQKASEVVCRQLGFTQYSCMHVILGKM